MASIRNQLEQFVFGADNLRKHFVERQNLEHIDAGHYGALVVEIDAIKTDILALQAGVETRIPVDVVLEKGKDIVGRSLSVSRQSSDTLFRLRVYEIGIPVILCIIGLVALRFYPLSEKRVYEIKAELERRRKKGSNA